jgi:hypothetical protein
VKKKKKKSAVRASEPAGMQGWHDGINISTQIRNFVCNTVWDDLEKKTGVLNTPPQPPGGQ